MQGDVKGLVVLIFEEVEDEDIYILVVEFLWMIEVDRGGMNWSVLEYVFQEFLKVSEVSGGFVWLKSWFMMNEGIRDNDDEEDDIDFLSFVSFVSFEFFEIFENKIEFFK